MFSLNDLIPYRKFDTVSHGVNHVIITLSLVAHWWQWQVFVRQKLIELCRKKSQGEGNDLTDFNFLLFYTPQPRLRSFVWEQQGVIRK